MKMLHGVTKGLPASGLQGGTGVGVFYLHRMIASKVAFIQNHPLVAPLVMIGLGHVLKKSKKLGTVAPALIGAGGYAGAQVFEVQKAMKAQQNPAAPAQTAGVEDTGALTQPSDIGMLLEPRGNVGEVASSYNDAYSL